MIKEYVLYQGSETCIELLPNGQSAKDLLDSLALYYEDYEYEGFLIKVMENGLEAERIPVEPMICEECGRYPRDWPSRYCVGCNETRRNIGG